MEVHVRQMTCKIWNPALLRHPVTEESVVGRENSRVDAT